MIFDETVTIPFIDISHHQGFPPRNKVFDFQKAKQYGVKGVVIRASHGISIDNAFAYNWPSCRNVLPRASYHYYENWVHPTNQAIRYWQQIEKDFAGMMFLDLEDNFPGKYHHWDYWYQFLERLKFLSGMSSEDIGIYGGHFYLREGFVREPVARVSERLYFKQYKHWYPWYFQDEDGNPTPLDPNYKQLPYTFPYDDNDLLAVQTGTPVLGHAVGSDGSKEIDWNFANGINNYEKIFKTKYLDHNSISIEMKIRR